MATKTVKNVGDILKKTREAHELTLARVASELGIRHQYLACIEQNQFHILPGSIYAAQYVQRYAQYLGLNAAPLVARTYDLTSSKTTSVPAYRVTRSNFWVGPRILKYVGIGALAASCFGYIVWLGVQTVTPPALEVANPSDNMTSVQRTVVVQGHTNVDAQLSINGQPVIKQEDGSFKQEIQLSEGVNTLRIVAVKKYSKEQTIVRTIRYDGTTGVSFEGSNIH